MSRKFCLTVHTSTALLFPVLKKKNGAHSLSEAACGFLADHFQLVSVQTTPLQPLPHLSIKTKLSWSEHIEPCQFKEEKKGTELGGLVTPSPLLPSFLRPSSQSLSIVLLSCHKTSLSLSLFICV